MRYCLTYSTVNHRLVHRVFLRAACLKTYPDPPRPTLRTSVTSVSGEFTNSSAFQLVTEFQHAVTGILSSHAIVASTPVTALSSGDVTIGTFVSSHGGRTWSAPATVTGPSAAGRFALLFSWVGADTLGTTLFQPSTPFNVTVGMYVCSYLAFNFSMKARLRKHGGGGSFTHLF